MTTKRELCQSKVDIGFSVNPEIRVVYDRTSDEEKAPLVDFTCDLGGTSANVARALANMDVPTRIYALTGFEDDLHTHNFKYALKHSPNNIWAEEFNVLEKGHMAVVPVDGVKKTSQVFGYKGIIQTDKIERCIRIIKKNNKEKVWRVATGVRPPEIELVKALFDENYGFRYLNPRIDLIKEKKIFFNLLARTDVLIVNQVEFDACMNYPELNSVSDIEEEFGISLIVVTKGEEGGKFYLCNETTDKTGESFIVSGKYDACLDYIKKGEEIYPTGTGDWFGGAMLSVIVKSGKSVYEITEEEIRQAITFASRVAGKKVTMAGPNNGPKESDL